MWKIHIVLIKNKLNPCLRKKSLNKDSLALFQVKWFSSLEMGKLFPLKKKLLRNLEIGKFGHPVYKSWLRPCLVLHNQEK